MIRFSFWAGGVPAESLASSMYSTGNVCLISWRRDCWVETLAPNLSYKASRALVRGWGWLIGCGSININKRIVTNCWI